jgi:prepilin peptidase CpaA
MFTFGWIGGGDAKLFAASALWLGAPGLVPFLFWTAMAGGVLSIVLMVARRGRTAGGPDVERWLPQLLRPGGPVPYGLAICAGALAALRHAPLAQFAL